MCKEEYFKLEHARVEKLFNKKRHKGFVNKKDLADWYCEQLKKYNCSCYFCETSIHDINKLINAQKLKKRKIGFGFRGPVLEIDKNDEKYTKEMCVLACYYCNNDKSYTTSSIDYKDFFGENRNKYFMNLLNKIENY